MIVVTLYSINFLISSSLHISFKNLIDDKPSAIFDATFAATFESPDIFNKREKNYYEPLIVEMTSIIFFDSFNKQNFRFAHAVLLPNGCFACSLYFVQVW